MNQQSIEEAPIVIVFAGDDLAFDRLEETLNSDLSARCHYSRLRQLSA